MQDTLHWSFGDVRHLVDKVFPEGFSAEESTLPDAGFDADSDWENAYDVVYAGNQGFTEDAHIYYGSLRLNLQHESAGARLQVRGVRQLQQNFRWERQHLQARMLCNQDALYSLAENAPWSLRLRLRNQHDPETRFVSPLDDSRRLRDGRIEKQTADGSWHTYRAGLTGVPVVADWALLAAVQRMPRDKAHGFVQLQRLERFFLGQEIRFLETFPARFGGRDVRLHGYVHTGEGMIPSYYWVADDGRLLIARYGLMALVYNAHPRLEKEAQGDE